MQLAKVLRVLNESGITATAVFADDDGVLVRLGDEENGIAGELLCSTRDEAAYRLATIAARTYPHSAIAHARDAMYNMLAEVLSRIGHTTYIRLK